MDGNLGSFQWDNKLAQLTDKDRLFQLPNGLLAFFRNWTKFLFYFANYVWNWFMKCSTAFNLTKWQMIKQVSNASRLNEPIKK